MSKSIFDLGNLIDWLQRQDPATHYGLWWKGSCLLGRYFAAHGVAPSGPWYSAWSYGGARLGRFHPLVRVACGEPQTYGAALERAMHLQARITGARRKAVAGALAEAAQPERPTARRLFEFS